MTTVRKIIQLGVLLTIAGAIAGYVIFKEALIIQALWRYLQ